MDFAGPLDGNIALVTGASRGIGRGIAAVLAEAGAIVYATGRTIADAALPETVIRMPCDHTDDAQVARVFERVRDERSGRLDVLANGAWGGYERMVENGEFTWPRPFWEQPAWRWRAMIDAGVRAGFVASTHAARLMVPARRGLIVHLSAAPREYLGNVVYGVSKAATDKMAADMAHELRAYQVTVVSLYPGLVRTEAVMAAAAAFDLSNSESPAFIGRAVAALAADRHAPRWSGHAVTAAALALDYGFTDVDGSQPRPPSEPGA